MFTGWDGGAEEDDGDPPPPGPARFLPPEEDIEAWHLRVAPSYKSARRCWESIMASLQAYARTLRYPEDRRG